MKFKLAFAAAALAASGLAQSATIDWNTWSSATGGSISTSSGPVAVTFGGESSNLVTNYPSWGPSSTFADGTVVANGPAAANGILQLTGGTDSTVTLSFSQAVVNPVIAIWSLGGGSTAASFDFGTLTPIVLSGGPNNEYGGTGLTLNGNVISGVEGNGTVEFMGSFTSITWTNPDFENWYGFDVGVAGVTAAVPEPGSMGLLLAGLTLVGLVARRRQKH
jgi:hypothetical protein